MLSLAHASTAAPADQQPQCPAVCAALGELTSAFTVLAGGADADVTEAARHAIRIRALMTGAEQARGPHAQLIARLLETCAEGTLRLARETASTVP